MQSFGPNIDALLSAGDLRGAAVALAAQGELTRARELFERIGDWSRAREIANTQGDRLSELRIALRSDDPQRASELVAALHTAERALKEQAAELCERERAWSQAATLRLALHDIDAALRLLQRAGDHLAIARINEQQGKLQAAVQSYRAFLAERAAIEPVAGQSSDEYLAALRGCARLLLRSGQAESAIPLLQAARRLLLSGDRDAWRDARRGALSDVESDLMECFFAVDEPELAERVFAQHMRWQTDAQPAGSAIEYLRRRAQVSGAALAASRERPLLLGRYRLGRLLGAGSVGRVYEAEDLCSGRRVALKLLVLAGSSSARASALYDRFCREAKTLSALRHPKLVQIEAFFPAAGVLALEYMAGGAVHDAALPLSLGRVRRLLLDVLDALSGMHAASVLHRDIKPHNLFFDALGGVKLGDFGIASLKDLGVTQTEGLVGTLAYMAPEQIRGGVLTTATDVYGLGVTAYQLATGRLPFAGPDFLTQHLHSPPPDARSVLPDLPQPWALLLLRMLHKDPHERCQRLDALRSEVAKLPVPEGLTRSGPEPIPPATPERPAPDVTTALAAPTDTERAEPGVRIAGTAHSEVFVGTDALAGRTVLRERFASARLHSDLGAAQLTWLRQLAALSGPGLQRIYSIQPTVAAPNGERSSALPSEPAFTEVEFQYIDPAASVSLAELLPHERAQLGRVLARLRHAGVTHGSVERALARTSGHITLLLHACGPLSWPGPVEDPDLLEPSTIPEKPHKE